MTLGYRLKKIPRAFDLLGFLNTLRADVQDRVLPKLVRHLLADIEWLDTSDYDARLNWACLYLGKKLEDQAPEAWLELYKYRGHYYITPRCDYGFCTEILSALDSIQTIDRLSSVVSKRVQSNVQKAISEQLPVLVVLTGTEFFGEKVMAEKLREIVRLELSKRCLACHSDYLGKGLVCHSCQTTQNKTGVTRG